MTIVFSAKTIAVVELIEKQGIATPATVRSDIDLQHSKYVEEAMRSAYKRGLVTRAMGQFGYEYRAVKGWREVVEKRTAKPARVYKNPLRCPANSVFQLAQFVGGQA